MEADTRPDENVVGDHDTTVWMYSCPCLRCRWEAWWNEADNFTVAMPKWPHPDGEYQEYFDDREVWSGMTHPNE